ncbi:MAG: hypothetical protein QXW74_03930 [Archaeoglobaceae archaeon]
MEKVKFTVLVMVAVVIFSYPFLLSIAFPFYLKNSRYFEVLQ